MVGPQLNWICFFVLHGQHQEFLKVTMSPRKYWGCYCCLPKENSFCLAVSALNVFESQTQNKHAVKVSKFLISILIQGQLLRKRWNQKHPHDRKPAFSKGSEQWPPLLFSESPLGGMQKTTRNRSTHFTYPEEDLLDGDLDLEREYGDWEHDLFWE